jgi:uncharacterized membrane protein YhhN
MVIGLSILALISAILCIRADYADQRQQVYIFKPLTMVFIIGLALLEDVTVSDTYKLLIIGGLLFSIMGDGWLMLPQDYFVRGLVSFLVAHIFYIGAFLSIPTDFSTFLIRLPLVLFAGGVFAHLRPHLGKYLWPVMVYMLFILGMGLFAPNRYYEYKDTAGLGAVGGALLFMLSDSVLAINKFAKPFPAAQGIILSTYFAAQWLIALSI